MILVEYHNYRICRIKPGRPAEECSCIENPSVAFTSWPGIEIFETFTNPPSAAHKAGTCEIVGSNPICARRPNSFCGFLRILNTV